MAKIVRFKAKRRDVIMQGLQLALDFSDHYDLKQSTKDDLAQCISKMAPPESWGFVMLNPDQQRTVIKAIKDGPHPLSTFTVWASVISFIAYDRNGEIMASRNQIAEAAGVLPADATRALSRLVDIGVLTRIARGRYQVNPYVAWSGPLHKRELAAKDAKPVLVAMTGGKV